MHYLNIICFRVHIHFLLVSCQIRAVQCNHSSRQKILRFHFQIRDGTHNSISTRILCALGSWHIDFIANGRDPFGREGSKSERKFMYTNILLSYHNYLNFLVPHLSNIFNAAEFVNSIMHKGSRFPLLGKILWKMLKSLHSCCIFSWLDVPKNFAYFSVKENI